MTVAENFQFSHKGVPPLELALLRKYTLFFCSKIEFTQKNLRHRIFLRVPFWELKLGSIAARRGGKSKTRSLKPEGCGTRLRSSNAVGSSRGRTLQLRLPTQILQIRRRRAS